MNTEPQPEIFTIKMNPTASALAILALTTEAPDEEQLIQTVKDSTNEMSLRSGEAAVLASALMEYADGRLRLGGDDHRTAYEFAYALGDIAVTLDEATARAARELQEAAETVPAKHDEAVARADAAFQRRMRQKRDEGLQEVFTGGPRFKINIWTGEPELVDEPERSRSKTMNFAKGYGARTPAHRQSNRVRTLEGVVDSNCPPVRAIADQESSEILAGATPMIDHNAQMKVEGAEQLILDRNRGITSYRK